MDVPRARRQTAGGLFFSLLRTLLAAAALGGLPACEGDRRTDQGIETMKPSRSVSEVLREEAPKLMALPGVAGVYEGALPGGGACIVVMIAQEREASRTDIPDSLGGYPVKLEFGGKIRPLR